MHGTQAHTYAHRVRGRKERKGCSHIWWRRVISVWLKKSSLAKNPERSAGDTQVFTHEHICNTRVFFFKNFFYRNCEMTAITSKGLTSTYVIFSSVQITRMRVILRGKINYSLLDMLHCAHRERARVSAAQMEIVFGIIVCIFIQGYVIMVPS